MRVCFDCGQGPCHMNCGPVIQKGKTMNILPCAKCQGEGRIFKSKYGGNDPDVWDAGKCEACEGGGSQTCEARGCSEKAVAFNDDGETLCEDCLMEWTMQEFEP